jgi:hypothetical protein
MRKPIKKDIVPVKVVAKAPAKAVGSGYKDPPRGFGIVGRLSSGLGSVLNPEALLNKLTGK